MTSLSDKWSIAKIIHRYTDQIVLLSKFYLRNESCQNINNDHCGVKADITNVRMYICR